MMLLEYLEDDNEILWLRGKKKKIRMSKGRDDPRSKSGLVEVRGRKSGLEEEESWQVRNEVLWAMKWDTKHLNQ